MTDSEVILALESRWISREELAEMLGLTDRATRSYLENLNTTLRPYGKCILSTASRKGYHIPSPFNDEDVAIANHVVNELKNKAVSLFARRQAIEDFLKYAESAKAVQDVVQLSLF